MPVIGYPARVGTSDCNMLVSAGRNVYFPRSAQAGALRRSLHGLLETASRLVCAIGLVCIVLLPMRLQYSELGWTEAVLWGCVAFYALEWVLHLWDWSRSPQIGARLISFQHVADRKCRGADPDRSSAWYPPTSMWLLGGLWLMKCRPVHAPGLTLTVFRNEHRNLLSVGWTALLVS